MSFRVADFFAAVDALPVRSLADVCGKGGLLVVAPHPDDESLGCGGLIATAVGDGLNVGLLVVSDGAGSHPNSRSHPPARLAALRRDETIEAVRHLGLAAEAVTFLDLPDRAVPPSSTSAIAALRAAAARVAARHMFVTSPLDPHCDHQAAYALARSAAHADGIMLHTYPIWSRTLDAAQRVDAPQPRGFRLDIAAVRMQKRTAIYAHRSQVDDIITDDPEGFRLSAEMIGRFLGPYEPFVADQP